MFTLQLGKTDKARNSTKIADGLNSTIEVLLKDNTSIISPTFELRCDFNSMPYPAEIFGYNYCYCPEFKRYYFISDIISETSRVFYIVCQVDVLATFRDDILNTKAFILYAESKYNSMLTDSRLPISSRSERHNVYVDISEFNNDGCFILTIASQSGGKNGCALTLSLNSEQMSEVADKLYSADFWDNIKQYFVDPLDAIISCIWIPISQSTVSALGLTYNIKFGGYVLGSGDFASRTVKLSTIHIKPYVKYKGRVWNPDTNSYEVSWADYRNCEPVSQYTLFLPGYGITEIPMVDIIGDGKIEPEIYIDIILSPITGDITYIIQPFSNGLGAEAFYNAIKICKGNIGVEVPVSSRQRGYASTLGNLSQALTSGIATTITGSAYAAIGTVQSIGDAVLNMFNTEYSVSGNLGGWSMTGTMYKAICYTEVKAISDSPSNINSCIGRPLYQTKKLGDMIGLVKCTGAYVKTWATQQEHEMIAHYVNSSTNFIFGGLIIE